MNLILAAALAVCVTAVAVGAYVIATSDVGITNDVMRVDGFGVIVNSPSAETSLADLDALYASAVNAGATRSNVYVFWNTLEPERGTLEFGQLDVIMSLHERHDLDATLFFSLVNGRTLGPLPDWMGSPTLDAIDTGDVSRTVAALVARYTPIDTVIIAGDADEYFRSNWDMIGAYNDLFDVVRDEVARARPATVTGNVFSLDRTLNRGGQDVIDALDVGDFVGFTYRPVNLLSEISKTPQAALDDLDEMTRIARGADVMLFEVGWSTSDHVGGSEAAQAEFARGLVEFADSGGAQSVTWNRLYDRPAGSCAVPIEPRGGFLAIDDGKYAAENLASYLCSAGILDVSGEKKLTWDVLAAVR